MEVTAVVLHKGALARYVVAEKGGDRFVAHLLLYSGDPASSPPKHVDLEKTGRHCVGSATDVELMDDIYYAAKAEMARKH
jgi:hypothetical protein